MLVYAAKYHIQFIYIFFLFFYLIIFCTGFFAYRNGIKAGYYKGKVKSFRIIIIAFCALMTVGVSLFAVYFIGNDISTYNDTYKKYKNGEYKEVEGYVQNFMIKQDEDVGSDDEGFDIGGVHFEVYAGELWPYWYSPKSNGMGTIYKDGQHVRVKYETHKYSNGKDRNFIMEITVID